MTTAVVNDVEIFYERVGEGDRIVMTHGAWSDGRTWAAVAGRLAARYEVLTWDRRGHSLSRDGDGPGSCRQDAADLAGLIEHIDGQPVHLVGNSAGGNVVLNMITMRGDLVKTAAVHEPGPFGLLGEIDDPQVKSVLEHEMRLTGHVEDLIADGKDREAARYFVDKVAVGPGAWEQFPPELRDIIVSNAATVSDDLRDGWDVESVDIAALRDSPVRLLISTGTESPELEARAAMELARRVPDARLESIPGAGHIPHRTHPDEYSKVIAEFIETAGAAVDAGDRS